MKDRTKRNNKDKYDYKMYVSNLGKKGTFYKDAKDSKGTEGTLVSIAEKGVYAVVNKMPFPVLFARADFGGEGTLKLNGKTYKITEVKGSSKDKKKGKGSSSYSDNGSYGKFGDNGSKKAKSLISFLDKIDSLDQSDDDDWEEIVEGTKSLLKAFK